MDNNRLKQLRINKDKSQRAFADMLGISQQTISVYEQDITKIKVDILIRCSEILGVSTDYLLGRTDKPKFSNKDTDFENTIMYLRTLYQQEVEEAEEVQLLKNMMNDLQSIKSDVSEIKKRLTIFEDKYEKL